MNPQQTQGDYYNASYGGGLNRSPSSGRHGYPSLTGMPSSMAGNRRVQQQQPPLDAVSQSASLYDDRFNSFDVPSARYDRPAPAQGTLPGAAFAAFGVNQSSWAFNGGAATMSGPVHDGSRMRGVARRAPLLPEWTSSGDATLAAQGAHASPFYAPQHLTTPHHGIGGDPFGMPQANLHAGFGGPDIRAYPEPKKDMGDLIPTAIVIKNIPFNVRKEILAQVMIDANLPQPYAFNYHFDQGVFRGLAFANFTNAHDTAVVIEYMNGYEIQGRKLRVEYKKMLPEHERERIEREKREKRGQLEEQHRAPSHQVSISSLAAAASQRPGPHVARPDMNDPATLQFYIKLFMFSKDETQEILVFPSDTPPEDRRLIHILAQDMGLQHTSLGEGENRQVHVSKSKSNMLVPGHVHIQPAGVGLDLHPRGLSRAATFDLSHTALHSHQRTANLAVPGSPDGHPSMNGLRGVKSFADLRSFSPSPSSSDKLTHANLTSGGMFGVHYTSDGPFGPSLAVPTTPGAGINTSAPADPSSLVNGLGSLSLGTMHDVTSGGHTARAREAPGAIGSKRPGVGGNTNRANPDRQPRTAEWESSSGFAGGRGRANGHMTRGSDSSDNTGRIPPASGSSTIFQ